MLLYAIVFDHATEQKKDASPRTSRDHPVHDEKTELAGSSQGLLEGRLPAPPRRDARARRHSKAPESPRAIEHLRQIFGEELVNRKEAAEKIAKLERLARGTSNPHEAESARAQAAKLASEHCLTDNDLKTGKMGAAFDDMVDEVGKLTSSMPGGLFGAGTVVQEVLRAI